MVLIIPPSGGGGGAGSAPPVIMARAPIATDDSDAGYFIGQHWIDTSVAPVQAYVATDVSVGAAVWQEVTSFDELNTHLADLANPHSTSLANIIDLDSVGDLVITKVGAPDVNDDSSNNWVVGDHIFDSTTGIIWAAEDVSVGAAVWNPINRILDDSVTNAQLVDMNQRTFKGRDFGTNGPPQDLTRAQATALMEVFTDALEGVAPASGGGAVNFLRADAAWAVPPASGPAGGDLGGNYPDPTVDDGADGSAIHDDVAAEISAIAEKVTPDGDDHLLIEDSADSDNKKRVLIKNLPGGGASLGTSWRFDSGIADADPGVRRFRLNNATQPSATQIFVKDEAQSGADLSAVIAQLKSGDRIYIQQFDDSAKFHLANVTGVPTDAGTYWKIPITITNSGADLVNNQICGWVFFFSSESVGDTLPVVDTTSIVKGSGDDTKEIRLEADGITTGTTRVLTMPDKNVTVDDVGDPRTDPDAIHDDVAAEISAITEKVTPIAADLVIIEDSADSNNKKRVQVGNLPAPAGVAKIKSGTYTGDGATSQGITGVGFLPKYVKVWTRQTSNGTIVQQYETTADIVDDAGAGGAIHSPSDEFRTNRIISLDADGFTVDDNAGNEDPNKSGSTYNYLAIG